MFRLPFLPDWLADIKSYGVMMTIAFLTGIWLACRRADRSQGNADTVLNMGFIALVCGVAGARAMFVLHYWDTRFATQTHPILAIFDIRSGGLEFWGGPILTIPALAIYLRYIAKVSARWYLDMAAPSLAWGLAITRIGCFLNGCCWGGTCVDPHDPTRQAAEFPWAVRFPYSSPAMSQQYRFGQITIPKELILANEQSGESYPIPNDWIEEAIEDDGRTRARLVDASRKARDAMEKARKKGTAGAAFVAAQKEYQAAQAALADFISKVPAGIAEVQAEKYDLTPAELLKIAEHYRSKPVHPAQLYEVVSAFLISWILALMFYYRRRHGIVLPWFLILYSISRVVHESLRQDNPLDVGGVTISQAISAVTFLAGAVGLWWLYNKAPRISPRAVPFVLPEEAQPSPAKG